MTEASRVPAAARRAALALHGLCEEDCQWMLASLPDAHRSLLAPLLDELRRLGLPPGTDLAAQLAEGGAGPAAPAPHARALTRSQASCLAAWLAAESPQVPARLIAACPAWRTALLAAMPEAARRGIERETEGLAPAPALEQFLRAQALARLDAAASGVRKRWWPRGLRRPGSAA